MLRSYRLVYPAFWNELLVAVNYSNSHEAVIKSSIHEETNNVYTTRDPVTVKNYRDVILPLHG